MKTILTLIILLTIPIHSQDNNRQQIQEWNIPQWVTQLMSAKKLDEKYSVEFHLNPFYLRGDFNGDGVFDVAVLIKNKKSGKKGIAICHSDRNEVFVIGAGKRIGNGGDDFNWMDVWYVSPKTKVSVNTVNDNPPLLKGEALFVEKSGSASALIYWDGTKYQWYQQGD